MFRKIDKKIKQSGLVLFLAICSCILFYFILFHSEQFFGFGKKITTIMMPFIYGFFIAYILNPVMVFIESRIIKPVLLKLLSKSKKNNAINRTIFRTPSVLLTLAFFFLMIYLLIILIVPQVIESVQSIVAKAPEYIDAMNIWINNIISDNVDLARVVAPYTENVQDWFLTNVLPRLQDSLSTASTNIIGGVYSTISTMFKFILGVIIAAFILSNKEIYGAQAKKIVYALLREERANNLINNVRFANKTFGGFLNGKIIDSLIIGLLCFIVVTLFKIPYAVLVSVIVGVTNIIPYFGPILGAIPTVLIVVLVDPKKALILLIIIIIIQQLDGNIIGPKILGDSTGLSSFWVIFAITIFGGLFGVFGMFIGVPLFAVIYAAIRTFVNERLRKKQLPDNTSYYIESDYSSDEDIKNTGKEIKFVKKTFENIYVEGKGKQVIVTIEKENDENNDEVGKNKYSVRSKDE